MINFDLRTTLLALKYSSIVFAVGFVLGALRVVFFVPRFGVRTSELLEIPIMLAAVYLVGRWIGLQAESQRRALSTGFLALAILLCVEVLMAALLFGKTPMDALFDKDPVSGLAYYLSLLLFAIMPSFFCKEKVPQV